MRRCAANWRWSCPRNYRLRLRLHGTGPANALQFKLVDASGENVLVAEPRRSTCPPRVSSELSIRQRQIEFAWGPTTDRVLRSAAAIELVVASGQRRPRRAVLRSAHPHARCPRRDRRRRRRSACRRGTGRSTSASSARSAALFVRWRTRRRRGRRTRLRRASCRTTRKQWRTVRRVRGAGRDVQVVWLPAELEARHVQLAFIDRRSAASPGSAAAAPADVQVMGPEQWPTLNAALAALAKALPRGRMPRGFIGEQSYWTLVGVDGGAAHAAVISEDGAIEPHKRGPSLEPFIIDEEGSADELGRRHHRARAARRLSAAAQVRWSRPAPGAVDRSRCRRHAFARAADLALHADATAALRHAASRWCWRCARGRSIRRRSFSTRLAAQPRAAARLATAAPAGRRRSRGCRR